VPVCRQSGRRRGAAATPRPLLQLLAPAREGKGGRRGTGVWEEEERGRKKKTGKEGRRCVGKKEEIEEGGILNKNLICGLHGG